MNMLNAIKRKVSGVYESPFVGIPQSNVKAEQKEDKLDAYCNGPHLYHAAMFGRLDEVTEYIGAGFDPNYRDPFTKKSALHAAAHGNNVEVIDLLIAEGFDIDEADKNGKVPLHDAVEYGCDEAFLALVDAGCDPFKKDINLNTILHISARHDRGEMAKVCISLGVDVKVKNRSGLSAIHVAAHNDSAMVIQVIAKSNAALINAQDKNGFTALDIASSLDNFASAEVLINSGANIETKDNQGSTPFRNAVINKSLNVIPLLIHANAILDNDTMSLVQPGSELHKVIADELSVKAAKAASDNLDLDNVILKPKSKAI